MDVSPAAFVKSPTVAIDGTSSAEHDKKQRTGCPAGDHGRMGRNALDPLGSYVSPKQQGSTGGRGPLEGFKILLTCPYGNPRTSQHNSDTSR